MFLYQIKTIYFISLSFLNDFEIQLFKGIGIPIGL